MAKKGVIMRTRRDGAPLYNLEPWVVGIYEYQIARLDREFVELSEQYGEEGYGDEFFGSETPYWRVLPVEKSISAGLAIFPYERVSELIESSDTIGVTTCICRTKEKMLGRGCDHDTDNCMFFGSQFEFFLDNGWPGRRLTKKEAYEVLDRAEEAGLVHCSQNAASGQWFICNCCRCCCGQISEVNELGLHDLIARSPFVAQVDEDLCSACEDCVERCPYEATSVEDDVARIDRQRCMGCGLCISTCTTEALSLARKPEDQIRVPAESLDALHGIIATEKGREVKIRVD
jgi:Pyruvate/2-oxoacid:ferredoxin oxidoreductase delta subunit